MGIIRGIDRDTDRQELFSHLFAYSRQRKIKVVAEGVETREEMETLLAIGVDYFQGYYFGKPERIPQQTNPEAKAALLEAVKRLEKQQGDVNF